MERLIRTFAPDDYAAIAAVYNAAYSDAAGQALLPRDAGEIRDDDEQRDPKCRFGRWVVEVDGQVVAVGEYDQDASRYHPRKFWFDLAVHPDYQGRGIGTALYDQVITALTQLDPLSVRATTNEELTRAVRFAERRGWIEAARQWESFLDVTGFDPSSYSGVEDRLSAQGIAIKSFNELADDPERDRKLYDLEWAIRQDFPDLDAATRGSFEEFSERLYAANMAHDAYVVAVHNGQYVGYSAHTTYKDMPERLRIGQTGVIRAYRRRGIALALKLRGVEYAKANGYTTLRTVNESTNQGILAINERMGFVKRPAWIELLKVFETD